MQTESGACMAYRVGSTSYVYQAGLVENVTRLAHEVADVELILFDTAAGVSNLPSPQEVADLRRLAASSGMTYTVHLPADLCATGAAGDASLRAAQRVIALTQDLSPWAYVFHIETEDAGSQAWQAGAIRALESLLALGVQPQQLALENLESYDPDLLEPIFAALPIARTLDVGHLWKQGRDPLPVLARWLPSTRVVHLHGVAPLDTPASASVRRDHLSLEVIEEQARAADLDAVLHALSGWDGVLTLEVFEDDYFSSRRALTRAHQRRLSKEA